MNSWRNVMSGHAYKSFDTSSANLTIVGRKPALLVVDVVTAFLGDEGLTLEDSIAQSPLSCGPAGWTAVPKVQTLIRMAREQGFPVIYTTGDPNVLGGATKSLVDGRESARAEVAEIPAVIAPLDGEPVVSKGRPSAFFGTPLTAQLIQQDVDSLIVCGCTTSGCVRATVVDGHSYGWPVIVAEDASFDRAQLSHDVSLFEMNAKYAQVASVDDIVAAFSTITRE